MPRMFSLASFSLAVADAHNAVFWLGVLIVIGCLIAAGFAAFRALWIACLLLLAVAIIAAALLL